MITMKEMQKLNDRAIVTIIQKSTDRNEVNRATTVLLNRYRNQLTKNYIRLCNHLQYTDRVKNYEDEFYSRAYEFFWKAVCAVKLDKIKDDNWKFVGFLDLMMRTCRKFTMEEILDNAAAKPIDSLNDLSSDNNVSADPDVEEAYWNSDGYRLAPDYVAESNDSMDRLLKAIREYEDGSVCANDSSRKTEREVFIGLAKGKTKKEIAEELGMSYTAIHYAAKRAYDRLSALI